jgi:hypothetical protein
MVKFMIMVMIKKVWVVEGRFLDLMQDILLSFVWSSEENHRKFQKEWPVPGMRSEPVTFSV